MIFGMRESLPRPFLPVLVCGAAAIDLRQALRRLAQRTGFGRPAPLSEEALRPPDSLLARRAGELAEAAYGEHLLGHGCRTWAFAVAIARHARLSPDPEALYVACLLHDLGLTERFSGPEPFELRGANAARHVCLPDEVRADVVHEAIALHTSLEAALGPAEVRLVQSGSGCDLVGLDRELVHPETIAVIEARWPKAPALADFIIEALTRQASMHPSSPAAGLMRMGFGRRVRAAHRVERGAEPAR